MRRLAPASPPRQALHLAGRRAGRSSDLAHCLPCYASCNYGDPRSPAIQILSPVAPNGAAEMIKVAVNGPTLDRLVRHILTELSAHVLRDRLPHRAGANLFYIVSISSNIRCDNSRKSVQSSGSSVAPIAAFANASRIYTFYHAAPRFTSCAARADRNCAGSGGSCRLWS
jgi:hypothetical protein